MILFGFLILVLGVDGLDRGGWENWNEHVAGGLNDHNNNSKPAGPETYICCIS